EEEQRDAEDAEEPGLGRDQDAPLADRGADRVPTPSAPAAARPALAPARGRGLLPPVPAPPVASCAAVPVSRSTLASVRGPRFTRPDRPARRRRAGRTSSVAFSRSCSYIRSIARAK